MAWVIAIRETRLITVAVNGDAVGFRKGPVMTRTQRVSRELPREIWERLLHYRVTLPLHRGAGPCGTYARSACGSRVMRWSVEHVLLPLHAYYAAYRPPMRFGAKPGPRGRRCA